MYLNLFLIATSLFRLVAHNLSDVRAVAPQSIIYNSATDLREEFNRRADLAHSANSDEGIEPMYARM